MNDTIEKPVDLGIEEIVDTQIDSVITDTADKRITKPVLSRKTVVISVISAVIILFGVIFFAVLYTAIPNFTLSGSDNVTIDVFGSYKDSGASAKLLIFDVSDKIAADTSAVNPDKLGDYTVTYSLSLFGKNHTAKRTVAVVDTASPVITLAPTDPENVSHMKFYVESGFTAADEYDGDLTDSVTVKTEESDGLAILTYTVSDLSGNIGTAVREVIIKDTTPPVLTLNGEAEFEISSAEYADTGAAAYDDLDEDITDNITVTTDYIPKSIGDFTFTYTVTDAAGNTAEAVRLLHVRDTIAPVITLFGTTTETVFQGHPFTDLGAAGYDDFDGNVQVTATGFVDTSITGEYVLSYTASDLSGNKSEVYRTVRVITPPVTVEGNVNGQGDITDSTVYLTFDDGPSWNITPRILDILKVNDVRATFFIVGYNEGAKSIIARAIAEGHTIAIHGTSHDYGQIYSSADAFIGNITSLQQRLLDDFGYHTNIIRFPGGSSNTVSAHYCRGIMSVLCPMVESMGYTYFDWNVSSGDAAGGYVSADAILGNVCRGIRHGRNNVVLMHDNGAKGTTADALQGIIDYGKANGFSFAALSSYTPAVHHGINN